MIVRKIFYGIKCNNCGIINKCADDTGYWDKKEGAKDIAEESGWYSFDSNTHYCNECWSWNDDDEFQVHLNRSATA